MRRALLPLCLSLLFCLPEIAAAQVDHLEVLEAPQLVNCDPSPFFRIAVSPVDVDRRPVGVSLGSGDPRQLFQVSDEGRQHKVVYVGVPGSSGTARGSYVLLLLDTSGSMNSRLPSGQTRFVAAKAAVRQSLSNFADGVDYMAVVPFDSRNVAARIRGVTFQSTRRGVEGQVDALSTPQNDNNTALYSAVVEALPSLKARSDAGAAVSLIVFTDGENDVNHPGDDPGLLGSDGLAKVKELARSLKVPITTVGFGVSGNAVALNALREIAWPSQDNYYDAATSTERLVQIFESARRKLSDRFTVLFGPVRDRRDQLAGKSVQFTVKFRDNDRVVASRLEPLWNAPAVGVPVADATCAAAEARAILDVGTGDGPPAGAPWERLIILLTSAAALAGLWFGAPRLMWPESYIPKPSLASYVPPEVPPIERPRTPQGRGPMPPAGGTRRPAQPTIVVPPRGQGGQAPQPRNVPRATAPGSRDASDETIYQPPPGKPPRLDR